MGEAADRTDMARLFKSRRIKKDVAMELGRVRAYIQISFHNKKSDTHPKRVHTVLMAKQPERQVPFECDIFAITWSLHINDAHVRFHPFPILSFLLNLPVTFSFRAVHSKAVLRDRGLHHARVPWDRLCLVLPVRPARPPFVPCSWA
jgi:hypothetical protein